MSTPATISPDHWQRSVCGYPSHFASIVRITITIIRQPDSTPLILPAMVGPESYSPLMTASTSIKFPHNGQGKEEYCWRTTEGRTSICSLFSTSRLQRLQPAPATQIGF